MKTTEIINAKYFGLLVVFFTFALNFLYPFDFAGIHKLSEPFSTKLPEKVDPSFRFVEKSKELGVSFFYKEAPLEKTLSPVSLLLPGGGVAVADVNGDGWQDFFLSNSGIDSSHHLYLNDQGKRFVESATTWKIANTNLKAGSNSLKSSVAVAPLFFDANNDGRPDLYISHIGCSRFFINKGSHFEDVSKSSGLTDCKNSYGGVPLDINGDGFLDLYVFRYHDTRDLFDTSKKYTWVNNVGNATNGGKNSVYLNSGDGIFRDATAQTGGADFHWALDATLGCFKKGHCQEIYIANDFGPDVLYSIENGKFVDESTRLGFPDRRFGMSATSTYPSGSELPQLHVSNAFLPGYIHEGNFLWDFNSKGIGQENARSYDTENCLWSWGAAFADFDIDGESELYVANGFISGAEKTVATLSARNPQAENQKSKDLAFSLSLFKTLPSILTKNLHVNQAIQGLPGSGSVNFAGHERDCLFYKKDNKSFENIARLVGVDENWDGRSVATIDYDNDGDLDLIITNRNSNTKILENKLNSKKNWIAFNVLEAKTNRNAVGAQIIVSQGEKTWRRYLKGGRNGYLSVSDNRAHFGLSDDRAVDVKVLWLSGEISNFKEIAAGSYYTLDGESVSAD